MYVCVCVGCMSLYHEDFTANVVTRFMAVQGFQDVAAFFVESLRGASILPMCARSHFDGVACICVRFRRYLDVVRDRLVCLVDEFF